MQKEACVHVQKEAGRPGEPLATQRALPLEARYARDTPYSLIRHAKRPAREARDGRNMAAKGGEIVAARPISVFAQKADQPALDAHAIGPENARLIGRIGGLERY